MADKLANLGVQCPTGNTGNNGVEKTGNNGVEKTGNNGVEKKDVEKKSDVKKKPKTIWLSNVKRT